MLFKNKTDYLMESIRLGRAMDRREKLNLIVGLSIPSMLAQISTVMMFFIDASMVGHLGAEASASIGLIESTTWLIGSLLSAAATGFSVQVAHFIGANDFVKARQVFRHALICGVAFSLFVSLLCVGIHSYLPYWLGGGADIAANSSQYFLIYRSGAALRVPVSYLRDDAQVGRQHAYAECDGGVDLHLRCDVQLPLHLYHEDGRGGSCLRHGACLYLHLAA